MRVYISGKIGEETPSPETLAKFKKAEDMLKGKGYQVFNPTTSGYGAYAEEFVRNYNKCLPENMCKIEWYDKILLMDLDAVATCHAIYMLDDWENSPGANTEYSYAMAIGRKIFFQSKEDAAVYRNDRNETIEEVWLPIE
ncbi:MAG: DUF4406 domain-containing protein [Alloprevotella sp.]|nr:DUF4406 domain-containing protein [Alloprevotella sp.]